jgi:hypothetical protein
MHKDEELRLQVEDLERRVAELTEQLRAVTHERDAARAELAHRRLTLDRPDFPSPVAPIERGLSDVEVCNFCDGEGVYWVHDFEMKCTRCDGTGVAHRNSHPAVPEP